MAIHPSRLLNPKNDIVFKKIFGQHLDLLQSFLNSILPLENKQQIVSLEYLPHEQVPRIPTMKNTIIDVKCKDSSGRIFIVEMQFNWNAHFKKRVLFGTSKAYVQQMSQGENYSSLCPVYGLALINASFDKSEEWFHHYRTVNVKDSSQILEGLELIFIELPKFKPQSWNHRKLGILWLRFLKEMDESVQEIPEEFLSHPDLAKAIELTQECAYTEGELAAYDQYWDAISVEKTVYLAGLEKGETLGFEKGEALGFEKGEALGLKKGEELFRRKIAISMLQKGQDLGLIAEVTELSLDELEALQTEFFLHKE